MKKPVVLAIIILCALNGEAFAGCEFSSGPCTTDSSGHTYRTEQNLGGGYNTTRDGSSYSQTSQTLGGSYRTDYNDGRTEFSNSNPYESDNSMQSGYGSGGLRDSRYSSQRR